MFTLEGRAAVWPDNFFSNHSMDDLNPYSVRAKIMASRNVGVTLSDYATDRYGNVLPDCFAEYVTPQAREMVIRIDRTPEFDALYSLHGGRVLPIVELPLIDQPEKRLEAEKLLFDSRIAQHGADTLFKTNPVKAIRYDVKAISTRAQARWILEELTPVYTIVEQVIDRELANQ